MVSENGINGRKVTNGLAVLPKYINFAGRMKQGQTETIITRITSAAFVVVALAVFKPFGLDAWHWQAYIHLVAMGVIGFIICMVTDMILKYIVKMPRSYEKGAEYIIHRNLWFQFINTPLIALGICLYRHFVMSGRVESNRFSTTNFIGTLLIIAFCSFAIGLYWRYKFRGKYLAAELEETRLLNEQLKELQEQPSPLHGKDAGIPADGGSVDVNDRLSSSMGEVHTLTGTTNETVSLQLSDLLYVETIGNYVKVYHLRDGVVHTDMLRATSKQMEEQLRQHPMIVRCHRAFLVNLGQVEQIVSKSGSMQLVIKHCHESIPVSRSNVPLIKTAIKG